MSHVAPASPAPTTELVTQMFHLYFNFGCSANSALRQSSVATTVRIQPHPDHPTFSFVGRVSHSHELVSVYTQCQSLHSSVSHSHGGHCARCHFGSSHSSHCAVKLAVSSAVSVSSTCNHSRSDSTQCSIQCCTQLKGDVRDQSDSQECDQACDRIHNDEESEKGQIEPSEENSARISHFCAESRSINLLYHRQCCGVVHPKFYLRRLGSNLRQQNGK
eukprot:4437745-Amphidinium_carterae.1